MKIKYTFVFEYDKGINEPLVTKDMTFMEGKIVSVAFGQDCIKELDTAIDIIESNGLDHEI